jgi:hypothetical protein
VSLLPKRGKEDKDILPRYDFLKKKKKSRESLLAWQPDRDKDRFPIFFTTLTEWELTIVERD